jgi:cytoskeletal protein CcmA (bactofilin family)
MAKSSDIESPVINIIGTGTFIKGDIRSNGDIRIDGSVVGSVNAKGKIVIGPTGSVEGELICQNADFSGNIKAQVSVTELLTLKATARLNGDITTGKLAIEPGARFSGVCNMQEPGLKNEPFVPAPADEKTKQTV